jgi:N-acetylglucosamine-6-sulfatase
LTLRALSLSRAGFWVLALAIGAAIVPPAAGQGACEQIVAACESAGFVRGGAGAGNGLVRDCIEPVVQGTVQPRRSSRALPEISPQVVAACLGQNPTFGKVQAAPAPPPTSGAIAPVVPAASATPGKRPNIVFILTDDLAWNLVQYMPRVLAMQKAGATFANYFVTDSLCCPSRSSIFTGRYPHDTGVFRNTGKDGGYLVFRDRGHEAATFATWLSAVGYRTAMLGKYLNGYLPAEHRPAPGWTAWEVAGNGYPEFHYNLSQDGQVVHYGDKPEDYLTDVLSGLAVRFIKQSCSAPFLIEIATFAPHAPYIPAPRDAQAFPGLRAPRTPAFDAAPDPDAAKWLLLHPPLTAADMAMIDRDFRKRAQSVLAVDRLIGALQAAVTAIGQENNTYFVFSSDNGYHMGEHRLMPGKMTAFDEDIRVPLIVTGPGVPAGVVLDQIAANVDLCPTFAELGGATVAANVDGRSLVPLLHGQPVEQWRTVALVEHRGPHDDPTDPDAPAVRSGNPTSYEALRALNWLYVEYADGEREYHDRLVDPHELRNTYSALAGEQQAALHATLEAVKNCHDATGCRAAERSGGIAARR